MKLNDIVMASTQDTKIRVVVKLYGTSFRTEHFPEYFSQRKRIPGRGHGVSSICRGVDVTWLDY